MLTSKERIIEVLDSIQDGICDDCLSKQAKISPRQQVNSICRVMESVGKFTRHKASCQVCGKEPAIYCHHIDYDKQNCNLNNLITLCSKCHSRTNHDREYWIDFFQKGGEKNA
jgi:5-methylcytosine-specific restriction endonuclease McrA